MSWHSCVRWLLILMAAPFLAAGESVRVTNSSELRAAVAGAKAGTRILLAGGDYGAGFQFANVRGEEGRPIVIAAADPKQPPVFRRGNAGMQFSNPAYLELHDLVFTNIAHNGLNIDDIGGDTMGRRTAWCCAGCA